MQSSVRLLFGSGPLLDSQQPFFIGVAVEGCVRVLIEVLQAKVSAVSGLWSGASLALASNCKLKGKWRLWGWWTGLSASADPRRMQLLMSLPLLPCAKRKEFPRLDELWRAAVLDHAHHYTRLTTRDNACGEITWTGRVACAAAVACFMARYRLL